MPSFKLNLALIRNCPPLQTLKVALDTLGRPADKDHGVLVVHDICDDHLQFGLFRTKVVTNPVVDKATGEVLRPETTRDELFDVCVRRPPTGDFGVLEVYTGSATSTDILGEFLTMLELAHDNPQVEAIPLDAMDTLQKLRDDADNKHVAVASAKVKNYQDAGDDSLLGIYSVNFGKEVPPQNAHAFLAEHRDHVESVKVKLKRKELEKSLTLTLRGTAFFTFSCEEADEEKARNVCRTLAGVAPKQSLTDVADAITAAAEARKQKEEKSEKTPKAKADKSAKRPTAQAA